MPRRFHDQRDDETVLNRRQWLAALGVGGVGGIAGCMGDDGGNGNGNGNGNGDTNESDETEDTEEETEDTDGTGNETEDTNESDGGNETNESDEGSGGPSMSDSYDTVTSASFETLNPIYNTEDGAGDAIGYALDQGYTFDDNNEYFPLLYDMSTEDGSVWTFTVREGLEFGDPYGEVTASTFVYLIQEVHQSEWAATAAATAWADVEVEETGDYEFQATLPQPSLLWPESYDPLLYPIPQDLLQPYVEEEDAEGLQQDEELLELQFTGNLGAYVLDEWNRGAGTSYSRNENYYIQDIEEGPDSFDNAPYFESASVSVVEEQASRLGALETGEADEAGIPPERVEEFQNLDGVQVNEIPQPYNTIISVNMRDNGWNAGPGNLFRYIPFRQALNVAISKDDLIEGIYRGLAEPHYTWQPRFSEFYPGDDSIPTFGSGDQYGAEVARGLAEDAFEQSEYDYSFDGDQMVNPDGDQVTLEVLHSSGQEVSRNTGEFIAQELAENLGINLEVSAIDGTRFAEEFWNATPAESEEELTAEIDGEEVVWENPGPNNPGPRSVTANENWDMSLVFGLNTYPLNPLTNEVFFDGPNTQYNPVGYYPEFDAAGLLEEARNAEDQEGLQEAFQEIFVNLAEEQPYIMLVFSDDIIGYNDGLVGPIENFTNGWDFPGWYIEE